MNKMLRYLIFLLLIAGIGYAVYFYMQKPAKTETTVVKTDEVKKVAQDDESEEEGIERVAQDEEDGVESQAVTQIAADAVPSTSSEMDEGDEEEAE